MNWTVDTVATALSPARTRFRPTAIVATVLVVLMALGVRIVFLHYKSGDYTDYYHQWYEFIRQHGGFGALRFQFANYNAPYLYLLAAVSYLPIPPLLAVKAIPMVFDALLAWYAYRIIALRHPTGWAPLAGAAVAALLPTIVLNSSMWGQADSTYVALALGGLYYLLRRRPWLACVLLGLALAFKLQTIFLFPVLLLLLARKWLPWQPLLAIPAVYALMDLPALSFGASPKDLLLVYYHQTTLNDPFSVTTPNVYQFLHPPGSAAVQSAGLVVTVVVTLGLLTAAILVRTPLTPARVLLSSTVCVLLLPFLLPKMHERYFSLAVVLTVLAAFWCPRRLWPAPVLVQFASLLSYLPFLLLPYRLRELIGDATLASGSGLFGSGFAEPHTMFAAIVALPGNPLDHIRELFAPMVDFRVLTIGVLVAIVSTLWVTVRVFRDPTPFAAGEAEPTTDLRKGGEPS